MSTQKTLPFWQKVTLFATLFESLLRFFVGLLFATIYRRRPVVTAAANLLVRNAFSKTTPAQLQWLLPTTEDLYKHLTLKNGPHSPSIDFDDGAKGLWIGQKDASRIIIYFHGGGYVNAASRSHLNWLNALREQLSLTGSDVSVLLLSYQLAPEGKYPTQLKQAANLLRHVFEVEGISPSRVIIGGDSAGGNLTMGVLSHLMHPHSAISPVEFKEPLLGAFLISPWISFDYSPPTFQRSPWDMLTPQALVTATKTFLPDDSSKDNYNEPLRADQAWWASIGQVTQRIFIWYGADEGLAPSIAQLAASLTPLVNVKTQGVPGATHVGIILDHLLPKKSEKAKGEFFTWLQEAVKAS